MKKGSALLRLRGVIVPDFRLSSRNTSARCRPILADCTVPGLTLKNTTSFIASAAARSARRVAKLNILTLVTNTAGPKLVRLP